jgi:thiosulfate dehydrogenase [quinone] large subunit
MTRSTNREKDAALGYLWLRATIGTNIFDTWTKPHTGWSVPLRRRACSCVSACTLPASFVRLFALALPWAESIVGMLMLLGIRTRFALVAGSLLILTLTFGATLNQDWESAGLQLIYATVYASLLAFRHYNALSVDELLHSNASDAESI